MSHPSQVIESTLDEFADDQLLETGNIEDSSTEEPAQTGTAAPPAKKVDPCPNCGSTTPWGDASWCPSCGFYPVIGRCVEPEPEQAEPQEPSPQGLLDLLKMVPSWGWTLGAGVLGIMVLSVFARLSTAANGSVRQAWAVSQLGLGFAAFATAHVAAYLFAVIGTSGIGILDIVMKPIQIWQPTIKRLPNHCWRIWMGAWGLSGSVFALAIVGGIHYSSLFDDWGVKKGAQKSLVQSIVSQARKERDEDAESLEEAMNQFVGEADAAESKKAEPDPELNKELVRDKSVDCLIIGYIEFQPGDVDSILLASVINKKLQFVARLSRDEIPENVRQELNSRVHDPRIARNRPFVKNPFEARWLSPVLLCQVEFEDWTPSKRLKSPMVKELLADAGTK